MSDDCFDPGDPDNLSSDDPFVQLPNELLEKIFKKIEITDYFSTSCVCKRFFMSLKAIWSPLSSCVLCFSSVKENGNHFVMAEIDNLDGNKVMMKLEAVLGPSGKPVVTEQMVKIISGANRLCNYDVLNFTEMELHRFVHHFQSALPTSTFILYQYCDLSSITPSEFAEYVKTRWYNISNVIFNGCDPLPKSDEVPVARVLREAWPFIGRFNFEISLPYALRSPNGSLSATMSLEPFAKIPRMRITRRFRVEDLYPDDIIGNEVEKIYKRFIGSEEPFDWKIYEINRGNSSLDRLIKIRPEKGYRPCIKIEADLVTNVTKYSLKNWIPFTGRDRTNGRSTKRIVGLDNSEGPAPKKNRQLHFD